MSIDGTLFHAEQRPSAQRAFWRRSAAVGDAARRVVHRRDVRHRDHRATTATRGSSSAFGANLGTIDRPDAERAVRGLAFGEARGAMRVRRGAYRARPVAARCTRRAARTDGLGLARAIGTLTADVATPFGGGRLDATVAGSDGGGGAFERFAIGGWPSPLVDAPALSQRIPMPALPVGFAIGTHVKTLRASTALGPLRPFYWVATTRENFTEWKRVAGVDADYAVPAFPAFAIPAIASVRGAAYLVG